MFLVVLFISDSRYLLYFLVYLVVCVVCVMVPLSLTGSVVERWGGWGGAFLLYYIYLLGSVITSV